MLPSPPPSAAHHFRQRRLFEQDRADNLFDFSRRSDERMRSEVCKVEKAVEVVVEERGAEGIEVADCGCRSGEGSLQGEYQVVVGVEAGWESGRRSGWRIRRGELEELTQAGHTHRSRVVSPRLVLSVVFRE